MVPRPLSVEGEHQDTTGAITAFDQGKARLVCHEIDHGRWYRSRMRPGIGPIPVDQYRGTGQSWALSVRRGDV